MSRRATLEGPRKTALALAHASHRSPRPRHQSLVRNANNFVYLVHSRNPGLAFGILSDSASAGTRIVLILGSIAVIAVLAWLLVTSQSSGALAVAGLALLLGGATGNVTDRIVYGAVTDFFEVWFGTYRYPAFNVADSAIAFGATLILLDILFGRRSETPHSRSPTP